MFENNFALIRYIILNTGIYKNKIRSFKQNILLLLPDVNPFLDDVNSFLWVTFHFDNIFFILTAYFSF